MASTIQVRVEDELKRKSDALFKDLGTDTTTAIRMFLTQAVATNGFPFEIKRQMCIRDSKKTDRIKSICTDVGERDACKIEKVQGRGNVQGCRSCDF